MNVKVLDIVKWYNPILTIPAEAVRDFNGDLASLAENMIATMNAYNGLGLAGPQAAASLRIAFSSRTPEFFRPFGPAAASTKARYSALWSAAEHEKSAFSHRR